MIAPLVLLLFQVAAAQPVPARATTAPVTPASAASQPSPDFPVQLGVKLTPDTVTVGQRFVMLVKLRAPAGATIEFPTESDSAAKATATATEMIGKPAVQITHDSLGVVGAAAYRLAAWDVDSQGAGLPDIVVKVNGRTGYVSLGSFHVFVLSVLPADSAKRIPKPPRQPIEIRKFDWRPWLALLAALVAAAILWRVWVWYRNRKRAPLDPYRAAERDFTRIEAMRLVAAGEAERHAALMSDVMRSYLSARVPEADMSQTSSELLASAPWIHGVAKGLGELLWRTDLIKFAGIRVAADEAEKLGAAARAVVQSVEAHLVEKEKADEERKAA
jgi:hypothetical protein